MVNMRGKKPGSHVVCVWDSGESRSESYWAEGHAGRPCSASAPVKGTLAVSPELTSAYIREEGGPG